MKHNSEPICQFDTRPGYGRTGMALYPKSDSSQTCNDYGSLQKGWVTGILRDAWQWFCPDAGWLHPGHSGSRLP